MKILILKPSSLGDVIQALPVLRLLRKEFPSAEIHWWIDAALAPLLQNDPDLTGLYRFHRQRWAYPSHWAEISATIAAMRRQHFDWVIDLQSLARSGVFAWLANGGLTIGLDDSREGARGFYDMAVRRASASTHAVDWYLSVLSSLKVPIDREFTWMSADPETAIAAGERWPMASARWIVLNPGARWANKRWPVEYFSGLVRELGRDFPDYRCAILGGAADRSAAAEIAQADPVRCLNLAGQTSLREMVEWIRRGEVLVTNDTGPMHIGAALGRPVVAVFGPTDPQRTGPYGQIAEALRVPLPCAPCLKDYCANPVTLECLRALTPDGVRGKILTRLSQRERRDMFIVSE